MGERMFKKRDDERTQAPIPMGFVAYTGDCFSRPQMRTIYLRVDRPARQATVRRRDRPGAPPAARVAAGEVRLPIRQVALGEGR